MLKGRKDSDDSNDEASDKDSIDELDGIDGEDYSKLEDNYNIINCNANEHDPS